jgi:hypothetical protein
VIPATPCPLSSVLAPNVVPSAWESQEGAVSRGTLGSYTRVRPHSGHFFDGRSFACFCDLLSGTPLSSKRAKSATSELHTPPPLGLSSGQEDSGGGWLYLGCGFCQPFPRAAELSLLSSLPASSGEGLLLVRPSWAWDTAGQYERGTGGVRCEPTRRAWICSRTIPAQFLKSRIIPAVFPQTRIR